MASMAKRNATTVPIRHGKLPRSKPILGVLQLAGVAVVVVAVSAATIGGVAVNSLIASIPKGIPLSHLSNEPVPQVGSVDGAVNLLLTGSDTRTGQGGFQDSADLRGSSGTGNNDVTMVLHISANHQNATIVSIPRDLLTAVPACPLKNGGYSYATSMSMFNTTLSRGGLSCTVLTAEKLTGLNIQYAAEISFDGVIQMSNAVGGVTVCLATNLNDKDVGLHLKAGLRTIKGAQALAFLRSRHGVGDGSDLGRISDQQLFMSSLMRTITSQGVLTNPLTMYSLANAAIKNMELSDTLTAPTTMVAIALTLKSISLNHIVFVQWPSTSNPAYPGRVVNSSYADSVLVSALDHDRPVQLAAGSTGRATETAPSGLATAIPTPTGTRDLVTVVVRTVRGDPARERDRPDRRAADLRGRIPAEEELASRNPARLEP